MKRIMALMLSLAMTIGASEAVYANPETDAPIDSEITVDYQYTSNLTSDLSITNKTATCNSVVRGYSGLATKVEITQTLQKKSGSTWTNVTSWNKTFNTWYAMYSTTKSSLSSGTYRLKTVAKVYKGSAYETITIYSSTASC